MARQIAMLLAVAFFALSAHAQRPATRPATVASFVDTARSDAERADAQVLLKKFDSVCDVRLDDVPLHAAVDRLRKLSGVDIFVNWKELERARMGVNNFPGPVKFGYNRDLAP